MNIYRSLSVPARDSCPNHVFLWRFLGWILCVSRLGFSRFPEFSCLVDVASEIFGIYNPNRKFREEEFKSRCVWRISVRD